MIRKITFKILALSTAVGLFACPVLNAKPYAARNVLLSPNYKIQENPYFDWVLRQEKKGDEAAIEKAKVEYLVERIRSSPYTFIRNGAPYPANRAAEHIDGKYHRRKDKIHNARDFIEIAASYSSMSGKPYLIKVEDGTAYPASELLTNELETLEENLKTELSTDISSAPSTSE